MSATKLILSYGNYESNKMNFKSRLLWEQQNERNPLSYYILVHSMNYMYLTKVIIQYSTTTWNHWHLKHNYRVLCAEKSFHQVQGGEK